MLRGKLLQITYCQKKVRADGSVEAYFFGPYLMLGPLIYKNEEDFREAVNQASEDSKTPTPSTCLCYGTLVVVSFRN